MEQIKNNKTMLTIIGVAILVIGLIGVTYAFFNYTRTGTTNTIRVGRINFVTRQTNTINLTNLFPIDPTDSTAMNDSTKVGTLEIEIEGDTDYSDGVEYLISSVNSNFTVNGKVLPISLDVTVTTLGTESDSYWTARESKNATIYKKLVGETLEGDQQILVGYIKPNTTRGTAEGVYGSITIKAYLDKTKIAITDTYDGNETDNMGTTNNWVGDRVTFTTEEWNSLQANGVSFQVKVEANEGIWVEGPLTAYKQISRSVLTPNNPINFANISSSSNGEGLYTLPGTENDANPIYYYRGAVTDNNVIFGGYCWQMVRTTDTGGIKMIYNGEPAITGSGNNISYDCGITRPIQDKIITRQSLEAGAYYYADDYEIVSIDGNGATYRLKSKNNPIRSIRNGYYNHPETNIPMIAENYPYTCLKTSDTATCTVLYKIDSYASGSDANAYISTDISIIGESAFNSNWNSVSDVGYMSNTRYTSTNAAGAEGSIYGKNVEWNGSNYLVIEDTANTASTNTTKDNTHRYSCGTQGTTSCESVRYYYYRNYYISLTNGEKVEDALYKMTGNGDAVTKERHAGYVLNQNDSTAKAAIESWFRTNLTNEEDNTKKSYLPYLEDTIWCNDRSFKTITGNTSYPTYLGSGWNPNGGNLDDGIYFGTFNRYYNNWYSTSNVPSMACPNETDRFSVSSSIAHLNYPVGLLTADEIVMAGGVNDVYNTSYYLHTGWSYSTMSPGNYVEDHANGISVSYSGNLYGFDRGTLDLRPVVSLKSGVEFETGGDGTPTNPYVVKYD